MMIDYLSLGGYELWHLRFFVFGGYGRACGVGARGFWRYRMHLRELSPVLGVKIKRG